MGANRFEDRTQESEPVAARPDSPRLREQLDDSGVVRHCLDGEPRAFTELVDRYDPRLINFVYRMVGDRHRGQDLVQETFVRVYRHLRRFDPSRKFSTGIYTIAGNLAKNELRNRSRNPLVFFQTLEKNREADHRPLEWEDGRYQPDDLYRKSHLRSAVEKAVTRLPDHHRVVLVLREIEGKSYDQIARITDCDLGTVKSRLNRARSNFARTLAPLIN